MLDETPTSDADPADPGTETEAETGAEKPKKKAAAKKAPAKKATAKKTATKKAAAKKTAAPVEEPVVEEPVAEAPPKAKRTRKKVAADPPVEDTLVPVVETADDASTAVPLFQVPQPTVTTTTRRRR